MEAEEHHSLLSTHIAQIVKLLEACTAVKHATIQVPFQQTTEDSPSESNHSVAPPTILVHSLPRTRPQTGSGAQEITCLPKLSIPLFSGDILEWQSFWDCFETAVHNNPAQSGVQKLNYL